MIFHIHYAYHPMAAVEIHREYKLLNTRENIEGKLGVESVSFGASLAIIRSLYPF